MFIRSATRTAVPFLRLFNNSRIYAPLRLAHTYNTVKNEKMEFKTETKKLLDIVAKSLYTDKEVFIRELLSNASDALEKQRYSDLSSGDLHINVEVNPTKKQIVIQDNGIGMSKEDLINNLGTIAKSGSKEFVQKLEQQQGKSGSVDNIIGQFGVGFYSSFIVADYVEVVSRTGANDVAHCWASDGSGVYEISEVQGCDFDRGTRITLHLKSDCDSFWDKGCVQSIAQKYSNFINFPIQINNEPVNLVKAIWSRSKKQITDEEYQKFFEYLTNSKETKYFSHLHYVADVPLSIKSVLYIPNTHSQKMGLGGTEKYEVSLYSRKVLIKKDCKELLPNFLRFVKGVVDCEDIPLNISRETYQDSSLMAKLRSVVTKKVLRHLKDEAQKRPEDYKKWYQDFMLFIKEGSIDFEFKNEMAELNLYQISGEDGWFSLKEYLTKKKEGQEKIFYMFSPNAKASQQSPILEPYIKAKLPVLLVNTHVDEVVFREMGVYENHEFVNIETEDADVSKYLDKAEHDESKGIKAEDLTTFPLWIKNELQPFVSKVVVSQKAISGPGLVISPISSSMRQMLWMRQMMEEKNGNTNTFREDLTNLTFQINPNNSLVAKINEVRKSDPDTAVLVLRQVFDACCIEAGLQANTKDLITRMNTIMENYLEGKAKNNQ